MHIKCFAFNDRYHFNFSVTELIWEIVKEYSDDHIGRDGYNETAMAMYP